ncbi:hypothetical protein DL765_010984 [Monosporascus sp. GIB2]|nr:hypothetical protein DL765_010984 [Monosporascus sp. GIB2]
MLLTERADASDANNNGWPTLDVAARNGDVAVVKVLLDKDTDPNVTNNDGWTPLNLAAKNGHDEVVRLLLDRNANASIADTSGWTSLHIAAYNGHIAVVKLLLHNGIDTNVANNNGRTPLYIAASNGHVEVVKLLLDGNADANIASHNRWTPLHLAAEDGHVEMVRLLLDRNADGSITDISGWTSLHTAAYNGHIAVVKLLLDNGTDTNIANNNGRTPLHVAASNGHVEVVKLLLQSGAKVNQQDARYGQTALIYAVRGGHQAVVELLLVEYAANPNLSDNIGRTPLSFAAQHGNKQALIVLLSNECTIPDAKDHYGSTPLSIASRNSCTEIVKLLLATDSVDVVSRDRFGWTPLQWARRVGSADTERLLLGDVDKKGNSLCHSDISTEERLTANTPASRYCDICTLGIEERVSYQCEICNGGDFDICLGCYKLEGRCLDDVHALICKEGGAQRDVLENKRRTLGDEHPDTIKAMKSLAFTLNNQGKFDDTAVLENEVVEKSRRVLGDKHLDTIKAMESLAITLHSQGELDKVASIKKEVLEKRRRMLGDNHLDTIKAMNSLAITLYRQGKLDDALVLEKEVLEKRRRILGDEHPDTISAKNNLDYLEAAMKSDYKLLQLELRNDEFRFISLEPGEEKDLIQCIIFKGHAAGEGSVKYDALSYLWGSPVVNSPEIPKILLITRDRSIKIEIEVTPNLEAALKHLHLKNESRILWIDAICINQKDEKEKDVQIARMGDIYKNAQRVRAWLGKHENDSHLGMTLMKNLAGRSVFKILVDQVWGILTTGWGIVSGKNRRQVPWKTRLEKRELDALDAIWFRPYWGRVWMIPELALSPKDPLIGCGDTWIPLNAFRFAESAYVKGYAGLDYTAFWNQLWIRDKFQAIRKADFGLDLFELLIRTRNFDCSEEKDRLRAVSRLLSEEDRNAILPGPEAEYQTIIKNAARLLLQKDLRILSRCSSPYLPHEIASKQAHQKVTKIYLPSWVPKLYLFVSVPRAWSFEPGNGPYNASGGYGQGRNRELLKPTFTDDGETLLTKGLEVDEILESIGPFEAEGFQKPYKSITDIANFAFKAHRRGRYGPVSWEWKRQHRVGISPEDFCNCLLTGAAKEPASCADDATPFDGRTVNRAMLLQFFPLYKIIFFDHVISILRNLLGLRPTTNEASLKSEDSSADAFAFATIEKSLVQLLLYRTLFLTKSGFLGIGPPELYPGSRVAILCGGPVCYVLHPVCSRERRFKLVGDAYVHGLMNGEATRSFNNGELGRVWDTFRIV